MSKLCLTLISFQHHHRRVDLYILKTFLFAFLVQWQLYWVSLEKAAQYVLHKLYITGKGCSHFCITE